MIQDHKSARSFWALAERAAQDRNATFLEILPTLTRGDLERLIAKRPTLWARFAGYLPHLPESRP